MKQISVTVAGMVGLGIVIVIGAHAMSAVAESIDAQWCLQQGGTILNATGATLDGHPNSFCQLPPVSGRLSSCQSWDLYYGRCPGYPGAVTITDTSGRLLRDGDLISNVGDPDIFIVKFGHWPGMTTAGFKRLFLNPAIFSMYGHLGGYQNVHEVRDEVFNLFETSGLFRNCESNDQRVYATEVTGEDDGILHHVEMSGAQAVAEDARFFGRVFCINAREEAFYPKSITAYRRLADVPLYRRAPPCTPLPACSRPDANPRCQVDPQPGVTYCPYPSPRPDCDALPACALPNANPACSLTPTSPNGRPWCPPPATGSPFISSISPDNGSRGTVVTVRGSGFSATRNYVQFGIGELGLYAATNGGTTITFTVPESMGGKCTGVDVRACPANLITVGAGGHEVVVESVYGNELRRSNAVNFSVRLGQCYVGGCSGQLCTDQPNLASTCEYRAEYVCYRGARCERLDTGQCGWRMTSQLQACLANPPAVY